MLKNIFKKILQEKKLFFFVLLISLFYGLFIITSNYTNMPNDSLKGIVFIIFHWIIVSFAYLICLYVLSLNKWVFAVVFPILNLFSATAAYYVFYYDISINSAIIESAFNTNIGETISITSTSLYVYLIFILLSSVAFAIYRFKKIKIQFYPVHLLLIIAGIMVSLYINKVRFKTISHRVPFSIYDAFKVYNGTQKLINEDRISIDDDAFSDVDTLTVLLIIGESERADHLSLNGYKRETCPELSKRNVISFDKIYSPWTHTTKSLPYLLTRADSLDNMPMYKEKSLISIFKKCNFKTYWLGNQTIGDLFAPFYANCDTSILNKPYHTTFNYKKKLDEELFPYFDNFLEEKVPLKLIIVHLIGSHWYYPTNYPESFEKFKPAIKSKVFTQSDKEKMINAYDNSVLYTDYVLSEFIDKIKNENSVMFYISDHGELLGENNKWLHAQNTEYEKNPAFVLWFSKKYLKNDSIFQATAQGNKHRFTNTSFLFHSVLQASFIKSKYLCKDKSIFKH